jgi:integrase
MGSSHKGLRERIKADGTVVYYLNTTVDGYQLAEKAGTNLKAAKALLAKRTSEIYEGKNFPSRQGRAITINQVLIEYSQKKLRFLKSASTRRYLVDKISSELGNFPATKIRESDVQAYQRKRRSETRIIKFKDADGDWDTKCGAQISESTINHETNELQIALDWAVRERLIPYNPIKSLQKLKEEDPDKVMLDDGQENGPEWIKLYNAASVYLKPVIFVMYRCGLREKEATRLLWAYIDLPAKMMRLPKGFTKGEKARDVPLYPDVVQFLASQPKVSEFVFTGKRGDIHSIQKQFTRAREKAGLRREITTHALRRTRCQIWDMIDERASCGAAGHSDKKVHRQHYTEVKEEMLIKLVSKEKKLDNNQTQNKKSA